MRVDLRFPKITEATEREQLAQVKSYLYQLVEQLQWAFNNIDMSTTEKNSAKNQGAPADVDFVVEQGKSDIWYYRKWRSGNADCWCRRNVNVEINQVMGATLYYGIANNLTYPFTFSENPMCQITCEASDEDTPLIIASSGGGTNVDAMPIVLCGTEAKTVNCNIIYQVHGRWK